MNNSVASTVTEFVLLGFPGCQELQCLLFSPFFGVYIFTMVGNGTIVCAVRWDQWLHTPMYILLGNFAFLEIWYVTSTVPSMLINFFSETKTISFVGCFLQLFLLPLVQLRHISSASWHIISSLLSAIHCTTQPSWPNASALFWHLFAECLGSLLCLHCAALSIAFLWAQHHRSLCEWHGPTNGTVLCPSSCHWDCLLCPELPHYHTNSSVHPWLLCPFIDNCVKSPFSSWPAEGLFHLRITSDSGVLILWRSFGHVCEPYSW